MKIYRISILLFVFVAGLVACNQKSDLKSLKTFGNKSENKNENENVGKKGDVVGQESGFSRISFLGDTREAMSLPNSLREVSGLSYDASANGLIAHDDELAILYHIDFDKREIKSKEKIGDIGDYEGVEKVGDMIYLINSAGEILAYDTKDASSQKYSTGLNAINNVEGLGYYNESLLVACKGKPERETGQKFTDCRSIYSFSLNTKNTSRVPFMLISKSMLESFAGELAKEDMDRLGRFAPSGIAVHPKTKEIYILSHKGKMLLVTNAQASIQKLYFLDSNIHRQPEGICFDEQNRMYIANESNEGAPVIYRYSNY